MSNGPASPSPNAPTPPGKKPKRWSFLQPPAHVPVHKLPEFQQLFGLGMLLVLLLVFALMFGKTTWHALERVFPKEPAAGLQADGAPADPNAEAEARRLAREEHQRRVLTLFEGS